MRLENSPGPVKQQRFSTRPNGWHFPIGDCSIILPVSAHYQHQQVIQCQRVGGIGKAAMGCYCVVSSGYRTRIVFAGVVSNTEG